MSVQFSLPEPSLAETSYAQNQGVVERDPDALSAFFQNNFPSIDFTQDPESALDALDGLELPFKYQFLNLKLKPYTEVENLLATMDKIVRMLVSRGYFYHASVLATSQVHKDMLAEPIRVAVESALEEDGDCVEELANFRGSFPVVDHLMHSLKKKERIEELLALVPWMAPSETRDSWSVYLVRALALKARIDEARAIIPQIDDSTYREQACIPIIKALVKVGNFEEARHLASRLQIQEFIDAAGSLTTFMPVISALSKIGHIDRAVELFSGISDEEEKTLAAQPLLRALRDRRRVDEMMDKLIVLKTPEPFFWQRQVKRNNP